MNETGIIWTEATWNVFSGCQKVSPGCKFCYAHTLAENKRGTPEISDRVGSLASLERGGKPNERL